ncbi:unnamed protein product, partial [Didymodactylos carnosus]
MRRSSSNRNNSTCAASVKFISKLNISPEDDTLIPLSPQTTTTSSLVQDAAVITERERAESRPSLKTSEDAMIILLDPWMDDSSIEVLLNQIASTVISFRSADDCTNYISGIQTENIFLIISSSLNETIIPFAVRQPQVVSIYVLFTGSNEWTCDFSITKDDWPKKLSSIFYSNNRLITRLASDIELWSKRPMSMSFLKEAADEQQAAQDINREKSSFMWYQVLLEILLRMPANSAIAKSELIEECRKIYTDNIIEQEKITEFERNYTPDRAIWWYTRDSFFFRLLNKALRIKDIDVIFKFRLIIKDLHNQLKRLHSDYLRMLSESNNVNDFITVYRGQIISQQEFYRFKNNIGGFVSINSFISTSVRLELATIFAVGDRSHFGESVIFKIIIDLKIRTKPFASISHQSAFVDEDEILLSMGTVFRVDSIEMNNENNFWYITLSVGEQDDPQLKELTDHLKQEVGRVTDNLTLGNYLGDIGDYERAARYYAMPQDLPPDQIDLGTLHNNIGWLYNCKGNYRAAITNYEKALEIQQQQLPSNHIDLAATYNNIGMVYYEQDDCEAALVNLQKSLDIKQRGDLPLNNESIAITLNNIGLVYHKTGAYEKAFETYNEVLKLQKCLPETHYNLATTYTNIGAVHYHQGNYPDALVNYEKALSIRTNALHSTHPDIAKTHVNIGLAQETRGNYYEALQSYKLALEIQKNVLPEDHIDIGTTYSRLGTVYNRRREYDLALENQEKALEIYSKSLAPKHPYIATVYNNMGLVYENQGDNVKALESYEKALELYLKTVSPTHPSLAKIYDNIGRLSE